MERSEEKREEKEKGKRVKGEDEAKCSNRVAANSTLGVFNSSLFVLHSSLIFFTLHSSLFVLHFLLLLLLSQILRELKSCHIEELMERRNRFHQA